MTEIINQVFALDLKLKKDNHDGANRYLDRIYHEFEIMGYKIVNPIGQKYRNEMTDVEANILGDLNKNSVISKVLKPIIYHTEDEQIKLLQKGIVIVD